MMGTRRDIGARRLVAGAASAVRLSWRAAPLWLVGSVALTVLAGTLPVAGVWLLKRMIDTLTTGGAGLTAVAAGLVAAGFGTGALPSVTTYVRNQADRLIGRRAQSDLYLATDRQVGLARMEDPKFHDRLRMAHTAGRSAPAQVVDGLVAMAQNAITVCGLVGVLAAISPVAAAFVLLGGVPALITQMRLSRIRMRMTQQITPMERREMFYVELLTGLAAAKELRLFGLSGLFRRRMLAELGAADRERQRVDGRELRFQFGLGLLTAAVNGGGLVWAITAASRGELSIGAVSAFIAAVAGLLSGVSALVVQVAMVHRSLLFHDHYRHVLAAEPDLPLAADPLPVPTLRRGIELRDVWFRYAPDQDWVLRGINLHIPYGRSTALVGLNGAGKTTVIKLLCRFYDPERGAILWDGVDLRELSITGLREHITAVFQDYMHYDLSAKENIGLGDVAGLNDEDRVRAAARRAGVDETIEALPRGYDTLLSRMFLDGTEDDAETGVLLSGGQWQRLSVARALMRAQRDLLILDEPSSGLDAAAEYEIHHRLRDLRADATSVLISHRLGAIRDADSIVVLSGGRIAEQGTHETLVQSGRDYAKLFRMQAEGYQTDVAGGVAR